MSNPWIENATDASGRVKLTEPPMVSAKAEVHSDLQAFIDAFNNATPEQIREARFIMLANGAPDIIRVPATVVRLILKQKDRYQIALERVVEVGSDLHYENTDDVRDSEECNIAREALRGEKS